MTRYHFFDAMYPERAKEISRGYSEMGYILYSLLDIKKDSKKSPKVYRLIRLKIHQLSRYLTYVNVTYL